MHASPATAAVYPATHVQSVTASLPSAELVFQGHASQLEPALKKSPSHAHAQLSASNG